MADNSNELNCSGLDLSLDGLDFLMDEVNDIDLSKFQDIVAENNTEKTCEKTDEKTNQKVGDNTDNNPLEDVLVELSDKANSNFTTVSLDNFQNCETVEPVDFVDVWADQPTEPQGK